MRSAPSDHESSRSVVVTGGNRGIGLAVARRLQSSGDRVTVTYRSAPPPDDVRGVPCDITDGAQVDAAFAKIEADQGPPEVIVANAGITNDRLMVLMSEVDFSDVVETNLLGSFRTVKRGLRNMLRVRSGRIILLSSVAGMRGSPGQANYAATKAGMIGLARSLAREVGSRGITVNVVAPGVVETDMTAPLPEKRKSEILREVPLGRFGTADDIARAVEFLASPSSGYITGAVLAVDGGLGMGN